MIIKSGNEQHIVEFDEQNSNIIVDGVKMPVVNKPGFTYKCYKRPRQIGADGGITALKWFFEDCFYSCYHIRICQFVLG